MSLGAIQDELGRRRVDLRGRGIVVLAGGSSAEREVSLASGRAVIEALHSAGYNADLLSIGPDDITFDRTLPGDSHAGELAKHSMDGDGMTTLAPEAGMPVLARVRNAGMVFPTLHGTRGEDGVWQGLLELLNVPYVSAGVKGSAIAMDKLTSKRLYMQLGVPTPPYWVERRGCSCRGDVPGDLSELVAKPVSEGSSVGVEMIENDDAGWARIGEMLTRYDPLLIEQRIHGRELTASVIGPCSRAVALPLVEIQPRQEFYDYTAKYTAGASKYICPAPVDEETTHTIQQHALTIYCELELEPYARIDCLLDGEGQAWFLEANTLPGFTPLSLLPKAAEAAGVDFAELIEILMLCALERWESRHGGAP